MPERFDAVIFDLGNTLIYFMGDWDRVIRTGDEELCRILQANGIQLERESFLAEFRRRLQAYFKERETEFIEYTSGYILRTLLAELGHARVPESVLRQALAAKYAVSQQLWVAESDAISTLQTLKRRGYRLGLISNASDDADVQALIDRAGMRPYFDVILTSAAEGIRKPNPRIFFDTLERLGVLPVRTVMVGDNLGADVLGAKAAGMYAIWITRRAGTPANRAHEDTIQPDRQIASLAEILDFLP